MSGRRGFVYTPRTVEDVQQRQQELGSDRPGVIMDQYNTYTVRKGDNHIRILPATWEGARHWGFDVWLHYDVGPDHASVICTNRMGGGKCYGCELRLAADRAGDEEESKALRPRRRAACWLIDCNDKEAGPQIWLMPSTLDEDIQGISIDRVDGSLYLCDDPHNGYDLTFEKTGERINTRYVSPSLARRPTSVDPAYIDYIADNPIPDCLVWRSYEEVRSMYEGGAGQGADLPPTPTPRTAAAPVRAGADARQAPAGYRGGGAPPAAAAPLPRRAFGRPGAAPPVAPPPVDRYQGEEYAVDPNYPPPNGPYGGDPQAPPAQYYEEPPPAYDEVPPWNEQPGAVNYRNPPEYTQPPQQYAAPPQRPLPQRRPAPAAPPVQQQAPPRAAWSPPGRGAAPPPAPQRGPTTAAETAEQLRQRFGR